MTEPKNSRTLDRTSERFSGVQLFDDRGNLTESARRLTDLLPLETPFDQEMFDRWRDKDRSLEGLLELIRSESSWSLDPRREESLRRWLVRGAKGPVLGSPDD